jgi:hypothetical protein
MRSFRLRLARLLAGAAACIGLAAGLAACSSAGPTPTTDCGDYCGDASATVSFLGNKATISGGGCQDKGAAGIEVRIGDWQAEGTGDFLILTGYLAGGPTPQPTPVPTDDSGLPLPSYPVAGSVGGVPFTLDQTAVVTFASATSGTFSGDDVNGYGPVSGTFTCG